MLLLLCGLASAGSGDVYVKSDVPGARILVDGVDTGLVTPAMVEGVEEGPHQVEVLSDDCRRGMRDVVVRAGAIERAELTLVDAGGLLEVTSMPIGAQVAIDGVVVGTTPLASQPMDCGDHTVEVSMIGHQTYVEEVAATLDQPVVVSVQLVEVDLGQLAISVQPLDAELRLDDRPIGVGPMTLDAVPTGQHTVTATAPGYLDEAVTVAVVQGETVRADLVLTERPSLAARVGLNRVRWGTVGVGAALIGGAATMGILSMQQRQLYRSNYDLYLGLTYADQPEAFYADNVARPRTRSIGLMAGAGVLAVGAAATVVVLPVIDPADSTVGAVARVRF